MSSQENKINQTENGNGKNTYQKIKLNEFLDVTKWSFNLLLKIHPRWSIVYLITEIEAELEDVAYTYIFAKALDELMKVLETQASSVKDLYPYLGILVGYSIITLIIRYFGGLAHRHLRQKSNTRITREFYRKINELDIQTLEIPELNNKLFRGQRYLYSIVDYFRDTISLISVFIKLVVTTVIVINIFPLYAPLVLLLSIPYMIVDKSMRTKSYKFHFEQTEGKRKASWSSGVLMDTSSIPEIRITKSYNFLDKKFFDFLDWYDNEHLKIIIKWQNLSQIFNFTRIFLTMYGYLNIFSKFLDRKLSIGIVAFQMRNLSTFENSVRSLIRSYNDLQEFSIQIKDTYSLFQTTSQIKEGNINIGKLQKGPNISIKNLNFKYPRAEKLVLENINLEIKSGEKLAIVGANGAGKTTLIKLISRFYIPTKGNIYINNTDLFEINTTSLYENMGVLFQEYNNYGQMNVKENILIGDTSKEINETDIRLAAQAADATEFILDFPNKFDQVLSEKFEGGIRPSTGQWQKIALARFFYRNAPLVIFDEPTASIDAISEYNIFNKIYDFFKGKTVIIISHRFSTVRNADRIIVLDKGKIIEEGNHNELMEKNGKYAEAFKLQAEGYQS